MRENSAPKRFLLLLRSNWLSWTGAVVTTSSFLMMLTFFLFQTLGGWNAAYGGMLTFLILPGFFVGGLIAIPAGLMIYRAKTAERVELLTHKPLRLIRVLLMLTAVNLVVVGTAGYRGFQYMESVEFCGTLCHTVMEPQYVAYLESAHARVPCVDCHIGEGASWFVKSKLSGARQVFAVLFDTYSTPIPVPVKDLRPARETCEHCHWPDKFTGDRLVVRQHFDEDPENTPGVNVLVMKTGGTRPDGSAHGIHWHIHRGIEVTYVATDDRRLEIPWVKLVNHETGEETVYSVEGQKPEVMPEGEVRAMDCVDCHNQPSHKFVLPEPAVDDAIAGGVISREIPSIRKVAVEVLRADGYSRENAPEQIRRKLTEHYATVEPIAPELKPALDRAIDKVADIWEKNVFPEMNVTWGTYRSYTGHYGCVRCHDDRHATADGRTIPMGCDVCHVILSYGDRNPRILNQLGLQER